MTLHVRIKFKITCPKHRRYDPAKDGEAGIKGGCEDCSAMYRVYRASIELVKAGSLRIPREATFSDRAAASANRRRVEA